MKRADLKRILAFLCALLLLAGCGSPAPSQVTESEPTPAPAETSAPEAAESNPTPVPTPTPGPFSADYELVWETLEEDYPYLNYLRSKGVNVDQIRERFADQARRAEDVEAFASILDRMFFALQNTAHLQVIYQDIFPMFYTAYMETDDSFHARWREMVEEAAQYPYYTLPADLSSAEESWTGAPVKVTYYEDCKTLCLTIYTFGFEVVERDRDVIWQAIAQYPEAENIVFDISGNSGGSTNYWTDNIVAPFGEDYTVKARMFYRASPRNRRLLDPLLESFAASETENPPAWAEELGLDRYVVDEFRVTGTPKVQSDAKRWVLVSGRVYSSSEQFVFFCKATGWATVIGMQTGGDGVGFDPALFLLPDSGLLYRFSIAAGENPDGSMSLEGTTPDVVLKIGNIQAFLEYIRNGQNA